MKTLKQVDCCRQWTLQVLTMDLPKLTALDMDQNVPDDGLNARSVALDLYLRMVQTGDLRMLIALDVD